MLKEIKFVLVETDSLLDIQEAWTEILEALDLVQENDIVKAKDSHVLGFYTPTDKGLDLRNLAGILLYWLKDKAIPILNLLDAENRRDKVYGSQA